MISLADIHETTATLPPRVLVHGQEGVGKTPTASRVRYPGPWPSAGVAAAED